MGLSLFNSRFFFRYSSGFLGWTSFDLFIMLCYPLCSVTDGNQPYDVHHPKFKNNQKCWALTSVLSLPPSACWLEEKDRVSHRQGLYGAWQGKLKPIQLRSLKSGKRDWENVSGQSTWAELLISLRVFCSNGQQPLSSPTQRPTSEWIVFHRVFYRRVLLICGLHAH